MTIGLFKKHNSLKFIIAILFMFSCTQLQAQITFSNLDAKNIYKAYPPKYGFEGVYEIYQRMGMKTEPRPNPNNDYDNIANVEYSTQNAKVCIYTYQDQVFFKLITEGLNTEIEFYKTWFSSPKTKYKVDLFGILTVIRHYEAKELLLDQDQDFITRIYNENNTLFYDVKIYALKDAYDKNISPSLRFQFNLKKIYAPAYLKLIKL